MTERFLMGLDLGGGGVRCLLIDPGSRRIVTARRDWSSAPQPEVPLGSAYDPAGTWRALVDVAREALARAGAGPESVLAIAATSMRHGSALIAASGEEILLAPNRDARGTGAALGLAAAHGAELHRLTGHWPNAVQPVGRLRWFATESRADLERAVAHLSLSDWIGWRLCGELGTEASQAGETGLLEIERPEWAWEWIDRLELPRRIFPDLRAPGSPLGELSGGAAEALGLRPGLPVVVGGADTQCGLIGAGVVAPGQLGIVAGSSAPVLQVSSRPVLDAEGRLWSVHHAVPERWALESNAGGVGEALEWVAGLLYPDAPHPIASLAAEARESAPGAAGLVSTLGAEIMDGRSLGLPVGNLTVNYFTSGGEAGRRRHLARSILEGMAFALRANAGQIEAITDDAADAVRACSGITRSRLFTQLVADAFGRSVEVADVVEASALGAALCAGVGGGVFDGFGDAIDACVRIARVHEPDPQTSERYAELQAEWNALREQRAESDARASGLAIRALATTAAAAPAATSAFRPHILVAADLDAEGLAALREIGDVDYRSYREVMRLLTGPALVEALRGVHVFVTEVDVIDAASLLQADDLRVIAVCRGDAVNVDLEACTALGIPVVHTPGRNADAVADLTLAFLLMLARKLAPANAFLREPGGEAGDMGRMGRAFARLQGRELWRKTVGLVGFGAVGQGVARRLRPFGARCLVHDPYRDPEDVRAAGAEPVSFEALLEESDFVSLHAAVSDETRGLLGADELARMRAGACVVNTARAALVDEEALVAALESGHLGGAALDVFSVEPPASDHPLLALDHVIATPHVGGNTAEVAAHQGQIVAAELGRLRRGESPRHALNPSTLEGFRWDAPRPAPSAELAEKLGRGPGPAVTDLQRKQKPAAQRPAKPAARPAAAQRAQEEAQVASDVEAIRARMEALVAAFVEGLGADAALGEFASRTPDTTLHFTLTDMGLGFHFGFAGGDVFAGMGAPEGSADVELKLRADLLDGMFTGRTNAMQAAMNGELSFSGDTAKAMTLQNLDRDLRRIYRAARERAGDPGDLSALAPAAQAAPKSAAAPATAAAPAVGSSILADDVRHELCRIVDELYASQLITATGGNVSVRTGAPDEAWITPSQLFKGDLRPEILVRIGMDGKSLDPDARSPSSEALMHTAVLRAKPEAQAVIHCHAPNATILVNAGLPFLPISTEAAFFTNIGRIPFIMPGTRALADAIVEAMADGWAVLMQNHGLLVSGRSLRRAADMAEIIERTAEVIIGCRSVGVDPPVLPEKIVETLSRMGDLMA